MPIKKWVDWLCQICIFVFGFTSVLLLAFNLKIGFIIGLLAQPFFIYTSWKNKQWGLFYLTFAYIISWSLGIYNWLK